MKCLPDSDWKFCSSKRIVWFPAFVWSNRVNEDLILVVWYGKANDIAKIKN